MRVCIYGGTNLQGTATAIVEALTYTILRSMPAVIVTGGFKHSNDRPNAISTDVAALDGARRFATENNFALQKCYEAWIPEPSLDSRPDVKGVVRLGMEDEVTLQVMKGRTPLGRRLAMVASVDIVITISGRQHTEVVIEQALDLGVPVLPIPYAGGDSEDLLEKYRERIASRFAPAAMENCLARVSANWNDSPELVASAVVDLIRSAKIGRCLVLLPYDDEYNAAYEAVIRPSVEKHMMAVRLDQHPKSEAIFATFLHEMASCTAVIVDVTKRNDSVMYELGFALALGLVPLVYTRRKARLSRLPVYIKALNVLWVPDPKEEALLIDRYLQSLRDRRTIGASGTNSHGTRIDSANDLAV